MTGKYKDDRLEKQVSRLYNFIRIDTQQNSFRRSLH
ncbi:hypothetical protein CL3_02800 [butyrate-producing bacterium SM4/1]|nr:hypothetical protein CLS_18280 [[Clostridium] cf. saccharolyticum K10]CBL35570.1 hypothetical protein CL3_02800 [butyrate-producing bacterium SM4/1]